jgi:hypothetical protein
MRDRGTPAIDSTARSQRVIASARVDLTTLAGAGTWATTASESGSINITTLTATEIKGTFSATMTGSGSDPGSGSGLLTNGVFDLAL